MLLKSVVIKASAIKRADIALPNCTTNIHNSYLGGGSQWSWSWTADEQGPTPLVKVGWDRHWSCS